MDNPQPQIPETPQPESGDSAHPASSKPSPEEHGVHSPWRARLRLGLLILVLGGTLLSGGLHLAEVWNPCHWLHRDGAFYYIVAQGLAEDLDLRQENKQPQSWYSGKLGWNRNLGADWSNIALGGDGTSWYPKHPFLFPAFASPFYFAFGQWSSLALNLVLWLLIPLLCWRIGVRLAVPWAAAVTALALAFAPVFVERSWGFSNDLFYTVLLLFSFDLALRKRPVPAGVFMGLAVFAKVTNILLAPALILVFALQRDWRSVTRGCLAGAIPLLLLAISNWVMFGSPLSTGYNRTLVVINGAQAVHNHGQDFAWSELFSALWPALVELADRWPVIYLAPFGLLALMLRRRWHMALPLLWMLLVPVLFHATYRWYRIDFLLPVIALSAPVVAAIFAPGRLKSEPIRALPWRWIGLGLGALLAFLVLVGLLRRLGEEELLSDRIRQARVELGTIPCDYFNSQVLRWECSHFDRNDGQMTGIAAHPPLIFGGQPRRLILLSPHPSGRPRTIGWTLEGPAQLQITYGLADGQQGPVPFKVSIDGQESFSHEVSGGLRSERLQLPAGRVTVEMQVSGRRQVGFAFDGVIEHTDP